MAGSGINKSVSCDLNGHLQRDMILCDKKYEKKSEEVALKVTVVYLAANKAFQDVFVKRLNF